MKNNKKNLMFQSMKSKSILMGAVALIAALSIGGIGVFSVNKNVKNNKIESIVNEISVLQKKMRQMKHSISTILISLI